MLVGGEILDDLAMGSFTVKVITYWISPGRKRGAQQWTSEENKVSTRPKMGASLMCLKNI